MKSVQEDAKGYVYFMKQDKNSGESTSSLDYPKFLEKFTEIQAKHEKTKYFTYRVAGKIFDLTNNLLRTNRIPYQLVLGILDRHRMINSSVMTPKVTTEVCSEIFYAAYRLGYLPQEENLEVCKYSLLNLIWNIFDAKRNKTSIAVSDFKQLMLMLCESSCFQSKLYEYFDLVCDHNQLLPRAKFEAMSVCFARIFAYIDPSASQFGMNWIEDTVRESYEHLSGLCGLTQLQFFDLWSSSTSKFASFSNIVALIQRLHESQFVVHQKECFGCHANPIKGLRFKCQQCRKLSLCLACFSTGFSNGKHTTSHKMYEISSDERTSCFTFGKFFSKMCSMSHNKSMEKQEIRIEETGDDGEVNQSVVKIASHSMKRGTINKSMISGYGWTDGQRTLSRSAAINATGKILKIAEALTETQETLANNLNMFKQNLNDEQLNFLKSHCETLEQHIKDLRECGQVSSVPFSSTPFRATTHNVKKRPPLLNTSAPLFNSIRGTELNKTFLEENKSLSINDLSNWFQVDKDCSEVQVTQDDNFVTTMTKTDTKMTNFKKLLYQVKEIVDDSYSDNALLAEKTKTLENELDNIIANEEERRSQKHG
ncbi:dystrophin-1 isoform X2 [Culicoides brevitarsis]|uniref:dystrophin-1 isoform X2 n=1 Tax=Culicoides brevitarsis TaxID=469753 RepID=UPI00307C176F